MMLLLAMPSIGTSGEGKIGEGNEIDRVFIEVWKTMVEPS